MKYLLRAALIVTLLPCSIAFAQDTQELQNQQQDMMIQQIQNGSNSAASTPDTLPDATSTPDALPDATSAPAQAPAAEGEQPAAPNATVQEQAEVQVIPPKDMPTKYSPDYCEFEAGFPEEPYIQQKCDGGESGKECYDHVTYTQTFALDATVTMRVVCNKIGQDIKDKYDEAVMVKTLEAMTQDNVSQKFSTNYIEDETGNYRLAGLVGEGKVGMIPSIFIAQMWLGKQSAMTIEAELVGEQFLESDALFRDLLRSVRYKTDEQSQAAPVDDKSEAYEGVEKAE